MFRSFFCVFSVFSFVSACSADETLAAYGAGDILWRLSEVDGTPASATLTMEFGEDGAVSGAAPCNQFAAQNTAPYPWFALSPILATKRACPALRQEQEILTLLQSITQSEVLDNVLILRNDAGQEMVFNAVD